MVDIVKVEENEDFPKEIPRDEFIDFLHHHLGQYGDKKVDINKAVDYAFSKEEGKGGFALIALNDDKVVGGVVINNTGMSGYIPQHILVYITTHEDCRGKGIGTKLLEKIFEECSGDVALHVEYDNPAVKLYEKVGFKSKYAEMRYKKKDM